MMQCPQCGTPTAEGAAFCPNCGAALASPETTPPPPTQPMPQAPPAPVAPPTRPPPPGQPPGMPPQQSKTGLYVGLGVLGFLVLVSLLGAGLFLGYQALNDDEQLDAAQDPTASASVSPSQTPESSEPAAPTEAPTEAPTDEGGSPSDVDPGYGTPDEAVNATMPSGWVHKVLTDEGNVREYLVGPPASEWTDIYRVEVYADGLWHVSEISEVPGFEEEAMSEGEAIDVVGRFENFIKNDQPNKAQRLTIDPFRSDPASAGYSNGDLRSFEVLSTRALADGTFWVYVVEHWVYGDEAYEFHVVETERGPRINDVKPA